MYQKVEGELLAVQGKYFLFREEYFLFKSRNIQYLSDTTCVYILDPDSRE